MSSCVANAFSYGTCEGGQTCYPTPDSCQEVYQCPSGSYCPAGAVDTLPSLDAAQGYFERIWANNTRCNAAYNASTGFYYYMCSCTPGFFCPENVALPAFCGAGYYCETPAMIKECPAGFYCKEGSVSKYACGVGADCPPGTESPDNGGAWAVFVIFTICLYMVFWCIYRHRDIKTKKESVEMEEYLEVLRENNLVARSSRTMADDGGGTNPLHAKADVAGSINGPAPVTSSSLMESTHGGTGSVPLLEGENDDYVEESFLIDFDDIRYTLPNGTQIMRGVSGSFKPGRTCAIMGASGAGKTTIMNLVTGKAKKTSGTIRVNGVECANLTEWKALVGFVPQEDVMHRRLSVFQNVMFSADMRLPRSWSPERKRKLVLSVLQKLKLDHVMDSIIGDEVMRGISGGQRKRVNVALELVANPRILFLDEPTSGLDSVSATELAHQLREIAEEKMMTIAAVIHSPGPAAFAAFHDFLLLQTGGRPVYIGPMGDVEAYFERIGFKYPEGSVDPLADFIMQVVAGKVPRLVQGGDGLLGNQGISLLDGQFDHMTGFHELWHEHCGYPPVVDDGTLTKDRRFAVRVQNCFEQMKEALSALSSDVANDANDLRSSIFEPAGSGVPSAQAVKNMQPPPAGFCKQFDLCLRRALRQQYTRFTQFILSVVLVNFGIGLFLAALIGDKLNVLGGYPEDVCYKQYPALVPSCLALQQNSYITALNFLAFIAVGSGAAVSASTFGGEQPIYWREASAGLSTPAYYLAKSFADVPRCISSAFFLWLGLETSFVSPMPPVGLLYGFVLLFVFAYISGYILSFLMPYEYTGLCAVGWGMFWGLFFSGLGMQMEDSDQWLFDISMPRWLNEAFFYGTTVKPFEKVPSGPDKGDAYYDMTATKEFYNFKDDFQTSMGYAAIICAGSYALGLMLISFTKLDKKK